MIVIDHLVNLLVDGEWQNISTLFKQVGICEKQGKAVLSFLKQFDAVEIENGEIKLNKPFLFFIRATQASED